MTETTTKPDAKPDTKTTDAEHEARMAEIAAANAELDAKLAALNAATVGPPPAAEDKAARDQSLADLAAAAKRYGCSADDLVWTGDNGWRPAAGV